MNKDIKDYLHLYLGCECVSTEKKPGMKRYILSAITTDGLYEFKTIPEKFSMVLHKWKPILRPLSDMTEEEAVFYFGLPKGTEILKRQIVKGKYLSFEYRWVHENPKLNIEDGFAYSECAIGFDGTKVDNYPDKILYLIKQGFDLFNLIPEGLAIDKTKITEHGKQ